MHVLVIPSACRRAGGLEGLYRLVGTGPRHSQARGPAWLDRSGPDPTIPFPGTDATAAGRWRAVSGVCSVPGVVGRRGLNPNGGVAQFW